MNVEQIDPQANVFDDALAEQLAQSRQAFENYSRQLTDVERGMIGRYYGMPPKMQQLYDSGQIAMYRVGVKTSQSAKARAHFLRVQGWKDAPTGTRHAGTELFDGDDGAIILWADISIPARMREVRDKAKRKASNAELSSFDNFTTEARSLGAEIERFEVRTGQASAPDLQTNLGDARRAAQARGKR